MKRTTKAVTNSTRYIYGQDIRRYPLGRITSKAMMEKPIYHRRYEGL